MKGDPALYDRWRWLSQRLRPGALRTLDAGCGDGAFTIYAATVGNEALGLSFDEHRNRKARHRATVLNVSNVQFKDADIRQLSSIGDSLGQFDQVICFETIEHIHNDRRLISDLASLLKPGGRLFLTTPFKYYKHLFGDSLTEGSDGGHVRWGYTHEELRTLFDQADLKLLELSWVSGFVSQQLVNLMRIGGLVHPKFGWFLILPLRPLRLLDDWLTKRLRYPHLCVAVVGEKWKR